MSKQARGFIWGVLLCLACLIVADWVKNRAAAGKACRELSPEEKLEKLFR